MPLKIMIGTEEYVLDHEEDIKCSIETINNDLVRQPELYAQYATLYEKAKSNADDAKRILGEVKEEAKFAIEVAESELDTFYREEFIKNNIKFTEAMVRSKVVTSEVYSEIREEYVKKKRDAEIKMLEAQRAAGVLKVLRDAFAQRKFSLITLGANLREQLDTDLIIKEKYEREIE